MNTSYSNVLRLSEEQTSAKELREENGNGLKIKGRPTHNCNNMLQCKWWFVVDMTSHEIVNGPFESSKIAALYVEEHESLCCQCVMNGDEILEKFQIDTGVPQNGRST